MNHRSGSGLLVWMDCEMTGLDLATDALIEVAVVVTDGELTVLDEGIDIVIHATDDQLATMPEVVKKMHASSGLTEEVRRSPISLSEAEEQVAAYLSRWIAEPGTTPLCGNSIGTDRGFIVRDMPKVDAMLHYRMIDVSSVKELVRRWYPRIYYAKPPKGLAHRALADILESITELRYYRSSAFVTPPGPSSDEARVLSEAVVRASVPEGTPPASSAN